MNNENPIQVTNLNFLYPNGHGIHNISFHLKKGEVLCLFGKNGSGKSTLMRVLSTLHRPQSGSFSVFGIDGVNRRQDVRKYLFPVFDENAHFDFASGRENLKFFLHLYQSKQLSACDQWSNDLDLDLGLKAGEYSYGMRRKLYLLEAFLSERNIFLFDEPSLGLDSETRDLVFRRILDLKKNDVSILFGSNRIEEAKYAERILQMENGIIKEVSSSDSLIDSLLTVKIQTKNRELVDYVSTIEELPDLVKKYLAFGIPKHIEVIGADEMYEWTADAVEKINRAPKFVRQMITKTVERYAREKGYTRITPEVVDEARLRFKKR